MGSNKDQNSQPPPYVSLANFPYDGFSHNVNFGSSQSQIPYFSSQPGSQPTQAPRQPAKSAREIRLWNTADDLVLVSGWLYTSKDGLVGTDQKALAFWKRIGEYFASSTHVRNGAAPRTGEQCRQRWGKIQKDVAQFCGAYAEALSEKASGMNDVDIVNNARQIYNTKFCNKFAYEYAWDVLRYEQKWINLEPMNPTPKTTSSSKRKADDAPPSSGSVVGEHESRPPGIKQLKKLRNKGKDKVAPAEEFKSMWEFKEKELDKQEKLQKMSLLETLSRRDTLDEDEKIVKKKLMSDLFGTN